MAVALQGMSSRQNSNISDRFKEMEATSPASADHVAEQSLMIARQPLYNNQMGVFGYELLYRPATADQPQVTSGEATAHVLTTALLSSGLEDLVYNRVAIINITRAFIDVMPQVQLPAEQMMLDLPDNLPMDSALIDSLKILKNRATVSRLVASALCGNRDCWLLRTTIVLT